MAAKKSMQIINTNQYMVVITTTCRGIKENMALMDWIKDMEDIKLMEMVASKAVFIVVNDLLDMKEENQDFKQK